MLTFAIKKKHTPSIAPKRHASTVSPMTHSLHFQQAKIRHILRGPTLQAKLTIGQPNDRYEQEADRVADQVMRMPEPRMQRQIEEEEEEQIQTKPLAEEITPLVQRQVEPEEEEPIQAKLVGSAQVQRQEEEPEEVEIVQTKQVSEQTPQIGPNLAAQIYSLKGGGQPLSPSIRNFFEPRFGHDFSQVRVHSDYRAIEAARAIKAKAFTLGCDIVFGVGQYVPSAADRKWLLAHELTHVVQQGSSSAGHIGIAKLSGNAEVRRKLVIRSKKEARDFKWFLTKNDARYFKFDKRKRPYSVILTNKAPSKIKDTFRFNILKTIINHPKTVLIRSYKLDEKVTKHDLYKDGTLHTKDVSPTLRGIGFSILGAAGVTIPAKSMAFGVDSKYSGPVSSVSDESWIFYSTPTSLAHEFGHAFLLFSGTSWMHGAKVPVSAGIKTPEVKPFAGPVNVFIKQYMEEKFAEIPLIDPDALHFSPTAVRKWPEPPHFKHTFVGTWLKFKKKYPGAKVSQKVIVKGRKKKRRLQVCVPQRGTICL